MKVGKVDAVIVVPAGYGQALAASTAAGGGAPTSITVYTDPSRSALVGEVYQAVGSVLGVVNLGGRPPLVVPDAQTIQTENLNAISYFVPSMLGLSVMQVGIFAAIPLVGGPREADPQAAGGHAAAALAAGRQQRADAPADRAGPDGDHRGRRDARVRRPDHGQPAGRGRLRGARRGDVPVARLRDRVVRQHRGLGERDDQHDPVPDDVPVRRLLPDRPDAAVPAGRGPGRSR